MRPTRRAAGSGSKKMILITGASGSVGKAVLQEAIRKESKVRAMYRSKEEADKAPSGCEPAVLQARWRCENGWLATVVDRTRARNARSVFEGERQGISRSGRICLKRESRNEHSTGTIGNQEFQDRNDACGDEGIHPQSF